MSSQIDIQLPEIKAVTKEKFSTSDLNGIFKVDKTGKLYFAVHKRIEKTKEEMLSDFTEAVLKYDKLSEGEKLLTDKPKKEKYKVVFQKWLRHSHPQVPILCENSTHKVTLHMNKGKVEGKVEVKKKMTIEDLPKPLKETIVILENGKPSLRVVFFTKTAFKWMEETLKINKLKYRWEK